MSMKAQVLRDASGNITIHMEGDLSYDHGPTLRKELQTIANENPNSRININLGAIDFVGASGICNFVETLKFLKTEQNSNITISNVKSEFLKVFKLYSLNEADYVAEIMNFDNDETDHLNRQFANRNQTFEN